MTGGPLRLALSPRSSCSGRGGIRLLAAGIGLALVASACGTPTPTPSPTVTATPTPTASATVEPPTPSPTATAAPPLSLELPADHDTRKVHFSFVPSVPTTTGRGKVAVSITNQSSTMIKEIVLRWPTPLDRVVFFAPFAPSAGRLRGALVQQWTRWVVGPGEMGEPPGTTSLGWGPILPRTTLSFEIVATRRVAGAVSFDLQLLAGEAILTQANGRPAETRVTIP